MEDSAPRLPFLSLANLTIEPVIAYRHTVAPSALDLTTVNPYTTWWGLEQGQAEVLAQGEKWKVMAGGWILIPPDLPRRHIITPQTRLISLSFRATWPDGTALYRFPAPLVGQFAAAKPLLAAALGVCDRLPNPHGALHEQAFTVSEWARFHAAGWAFIAELIERVIRSGGEMTPPQTQDERLNRVLTLLRMHLRAGPLPYAEWQRQVGLSRAQLNRLAQRELGESLHARRDALLLNAIRHQLNIAADSSKELAARFGFVDAAHFAHWVRRHTGKRPKDLRGTLV